ncbi:helix-turn-helix transcriptional regulator [Chryseobacterium oryctis]|uniref:HTH luxR-type domain-containing protein n=1 Tax=Chryseobacterium oryctis TaxID=2952618 RepID=A0ABT3HRJ5_9FLAO|nr:hypothetical protein [Chryseobacterium oryctis]MCW3162416.1 hypothetical protein [Chryseobacterium oryctis]
MKNIKDLFGLLFFFYFSLTSAQVGFSISEIDSLQKKEHKRLANVGDIKGIVLQEKKLIKYSQKINYFKGELNGYLNLAQALKALDRNKDSFYFLDIAEKKLLKSTDNLLKSRLFFLYGINYHSLGLHQQAIKSFDKSLEFAYKIKEKEERDRRMYEVYDWKRSSFAFLNKMDSVISNERKCMKAPRPMLYITIAKRHLPQNIDSAEYYINKANELVLAKKAPAEGKANVLRAYGELFIEKKECQKALEYLFESLKISQRMGQKKRSLETYKLISQAYKKLNDVQHQNEYLTKYSELNDSIIQVERSILNVPIEKFLNERNTKSENKDTKDFYIFIFIVVLGSGMAILFIAKMYLKRQKQKDLVINQKEQEAEILRKKLNKAYEEVIRLAVNADPAFITRFKETYPEFYKNITSKYPELTPNDIKLCAYIKLNFSNKEIAEYDCISIRTVESKKYRLRRKLGLSTEIDFNKWVLTH